MPQNRKRPFSKIIDHEPLDFRQERSPASHKRSPEVLRYQNQCSSPLLRLPRELRDLIIEHALPQCEDQAFRLWLGKGTLPYELLGTCHQLREESLELFYKTNTVCITGRQDIEKMLDTRTNHHKLIKRARVIPCERPSYRQALELANYHAVDCGLDPKIVWVTWFGNPICPPGGGLSDVAGFVNSFGCEEEYSADRFARLWDSAHWSRRNDPGSRAGAPKSWNAARIRADVV